MEEILKQIEEKYRERIENSAERLIAAQERNTSLLLALEEEKKRVVAYYEAIAQKEAAEKILNSTNIDDIVNP